MAGTASVHGSEGQFEPVIVPILQSTAMQGFPFWVSLSIGTVPFPLGTLCCHPVSGGPGRLFMIQGVDQPSPCTSGGGVNASIAVHMSRRECASNIF